MKFSSLIEQTNSKILEIKKLIEKELRVDEIDVIDDYTLNGKVKTRKKNDFDKKLRALIAKSEFKEQCKIKIGMSAKEFNLVKFEIKLEKSED